jgi:hypothetical protein
MNWWMVDGEWWMVKECRKNTLHNFMQGIAL